MTRKKTEVCLLTGAANTDVSTYYNNDVMEAELTHKTQKYYTGDKD